MPVFLDNQFVARLREINRERLRRRRDGHAAKKGWAPGRRRRAPYAAPKLVGKPAEPLVSIIVVGFNGAVHLHELAASIQRQTYLHREVIYVDNASVDGSSEAFVALCPEARIVQNTENVGFAEGNNVGMDHARGDFVLLLNNDAALEDDALAVMVSCMVRDDTIGALCPRIRFWEPFVECVITSPKDLGDAVVRITQSDSGYHKVIAKGPVSRSRKTVLLPVSARRITVEQPDGQTGPGSALPFSLTVEGRAVPSHEPIPVHQGRWILNNAGSWVTAEGDQADWGFGEPDEGQYAQACRVDAFCGCCVLIRPAALGLQPLFAPNLFAYYEDADASVRIADNGYQIVYIPDAVVRHKHAATSSSTSRFSDFITRRNRAVFQSAHFPGFYPGKLLSRLAEWRDQPVARSSLAQLIGPGVFAPDRLLVDDTLSLAAQAMNGAIFHRTWPRPRIGIYNEFWSSRGGGELRALHVARALLKRGDVYLISRKPLDVAALCAHFGLDHRGLRLAVMPSFSEKDSVSLDLLVNTTFTSSLYPRARKSIYLVSFPHWRGDASAMDHYDLLLANSLFTQRWCENVWPGARTALLYPAAASVERKQARREDKIILSIGRFFHSGHNKRQLEMIEAFRRLAADPRHAGWRLVLIGGCNDQNKSDREYLAMVKRRAEGLPVDIHVGASAEVVRDALDRSAIYWHATGVGLPDHEPEKFEHFGMAIVEAMAHGLVPVVHDRGGPPEIVSDGHSGLHFRDLDQLVDRTRSLMALFQDDVARFGLMSEAARDRAGAFSIAAHDRQLDELIEAHHLL